MKIPLGVEPKFGGLARQLERWATSDAASYKLMVLLLALCGYAYFLGALLVVALAALIVLDLLAMFYLLSFAIYVLAPFFVFIAVILRALWVRLEPPTGYRVTAETAPRLFAMLDAVRAQARSPRIREVLIDKEFNAGVTQVPRLGLFGWNRNYLNIGLPVMQSVALDELAAILAHEFGHLAGRHGWFRSWIYRLRATWWRTACALQVRARWSRWLFKPFYAGYVPLFNAVSFALARADEYEADRMSAEITGPDAVARSLTRVGTVGHYLSQRFWPSLLATANNYEEPPYLPLARLSDEFRRPLADAVIGEGFHAALAHSTDLDDTHPSLGDRLRAIGAAAPRLRPIDRSAADDLLEPDLVAKIVEKLDREWRWAALEAWKEHFEQSRNDRQTLSDLDGKVKYGSPTAKERLRRAELTEQFMGEVDAAPLYREIVATNAKCAQARFALGRILIDRNDGAGLALLDAAITLDDRFAAAGWQLAYLYMARIGRAHDAEAYRLRLVAQRAIEERAAEQRIAPRRRDRLEDHGLDRETMTALAERIGAFNSVRHAYLVRKRVSVLPYRPYYILAVVSTTPIEQMDFSLAQALADTIDLPSEATVIQITWRTRWLLRRVRRMPSALLLSKP